MLRAGVLLAMCAAASALVPSLRCPMMGGGPVGVRGRGFAGLARDAPRSARVGRRVVWKAQTRSSTAEGVQLDVIPPLTQRAPLKVGLIVEPTPFTHVSGYSNRYQETLKYLADAGDNVEIVCPDDSEAPPKDFLGFPIYYTPGFRFSLYNSICLSYDHSLVGKEMLERLKPDLLHVTTPGFIPIVATICAKLYDVPLVLSYHTHLPVYADKYLGFIPYIVDLSWLAIKYLHSQADLTLVTSPQLKAEFEEHGVERVEVWRKGIDTVKFNPKWRNPGTRNELTDGNPDDLLLVYVGRLGREKRIEDLLPVMQADIGVRLAIVGTGPYEGELRRKFAGTRTIFTGLRQGQALWESFASADLFIMPSDSETLGFVVLESLASGVPVLGANAGGIPDLIQEGRTGHLFTPGDSASLISLVKRFVDNRKLRDEMGAAGRAYAESYSWESATSVLRNVQYTQAQASFEATKAVSSPALRAAKVAALIFIGLWTGVVIWAGIFIDSLVQRLNPAKAD